MKIARLKLIQFRRFTELEIADLPQTARLVVLAGPNGCGKSSIFDALRFWHWGHAYGNWPWDASYYDKGADPTKDWQGRVEVSPHGAPLQSNSLGAKRALAVRTAYRNEPDVQLQQIKKQAAILDDARISRMMEADASVANNYQRLASQGLEDLYGSEPGTQTFEAYRQKQIGAVRGAMQRLFPGLNFTGPGNPMKDGTFRFDKGSVLAFAYKNLSGGEKAAFDLLLDLSIKVTEYTDTVFCIDEPEAHMSTRIQGDLLDELLKMVPENSQLWIATHSVGMMRRARDLSRKLPGGVAFIDFHDKDFDQPQVLRPIQPDRGFWERSLKVTVDDLAALVLPELIVICEGTPPDSEVRNSDVDASCFEVVFATHRADARFVSSGNGLSVEGDRLAIARLLNKVASGVTVIRLIDRDGMSDDERGQWLSKGLRVLSRRHIESYLFDDEVLRALCLAEGKPEKGEELILAKTAALTKAAEAPRCRPPDDMKAVAGEIFNAAKPLLQLNKLPLHDPQAGGYA